MNTLLHTLLISTTILLHTLHAQPTNTPNTNEAPTPLNNQNNITNKLEQTEATYQLNLRKIHTPILLDYLNKLETLQTQFQAQSRNEHAQHITTEINKIRQLITTTGILPTHPTNQTPNNNTPPTQIKTTLALNTTDATTNTNKLTALPLGNITWNIDNLPGGLYDITIIYAATSLPQDEFITLTIGTHQLTHTITTDLATGNDQTFRITKLGRLLITTNLHNTTANLHNANPDNPFLHIRNILLTPSPSPKN